ncbi:MAG: hypothetical protein Q8L47_03630 [bacterium]|nr:hypothetical protein [bacterium]
MKLQKISMVFAVMSLLIPILAGAQQYGPPEPGGVGGIPEVPLSMAYIVNLLDIVVYWLFSIFLIVAVIFLLIAAFKYLMSGGDATKVGEATRAVIYAAVAIGVALLSASVTSLVKTFIDSG